MRDELSDPALRASPRKRSRRWDAQGGVHFITFSCYRRLPLLGSPAIRDLFVQTLDQVRRRHGCKLIAWVVMPEHVHVVLVPTAADGSGSTLPSILIAMKKTVATIALARWRQLQWSGLAELADRRGTQHFWQAGGGFDRNVRDAAELYREVIYVHQNAVKRGLVEKSVDWAWSSARSYAGASGGWPDQPLKHDFIMIDSNEFPGPRAERWLGDVV